MEIEGDDGLLMTFESANEVWILGLGVHLVGVLKYLYKQKDKE